MTDIWEFTWDWENEIGLMGRSWSEATHEILRADWSVTWRVARELRLCRRWFSRWDSKNFARDLQFAFDWKVTYLSSSLVDIATRFSETVGANQGLIDIVILIFFFRFFSSLLRDFPRRSDNQEREIVFLIPRMKPRDLSETVGCNLGQGD
jgi:hypothetical protein